VLFSFYEIISDLLWNYLGPDLVKIQSKFAMVWLYSVKQTVVSLDTDKGPLKVWRAPCVGTMKSEENFITISI